MSQDSYNDAMDADKQISMEESIAEIIADHKNDGELGDDDISEMGRRILKMVLREFRPDLFDGDKRTELEEQLLQRAKGKWEDEGECEFDSDAVVSLSEDQDGIQGAYVQGWLWVDKPREEP